MPERLPYPGLRAFTREESDLFFGREGSVDTMVDCLARDRFMAVLGPSGSGKSSLVRTGLLDALDLGLLRAAGSKWKIADMHPGGEPMVKLAEALLSVRSGPPADATDVEMMTAFLRQGPRSVIKWATAGSLAPGTNLLILVDQFEELFRYADYAQREMAEAFVATLLEASSTPDASIYVLLTMRSEYLGACASVTGLAERISIGLYLAPRMDRDQCQEAIEGPAGVVGFKVEPALVNRMLNDLAGFAPWQDHEEGDLAAQLARQADQLPLMQHVLNRLWLRALDDAGGQPVVLTLADYQEIGGLSGALDAHGDEVIASLGPRRKELIATIFRALISGNSLATAVRRPSRMKELIEISGGRRNDVEAVVNAFREQGCNFLRTSADTLADSTIVDISHESLIRQWTPLSKWLEDEARDANEWRRLTSDEERYRLGEGGLLSGLNYQSSAAWWAAASPTEVWAQRHGGNFEGVKTFLEASREEEERHALEESRQQRAVRRRLLLGLAAAAVALVVVSFSLVSAVRQTKVVHEQAKYAQTEQGLATSNLIKLTASQQSLQQANDELQKKQVAIAKADAVLTGTVQELERERLQLQAKTNEATASEAEAKSNEQQLVATLDGLSKEIFSDSSNYLVTGAQTMKSELIQGIITSEANTAKQHAEMSPAMILRDDYRSAVALERAGDAELAVVELKSGYDKGQALIASMQASRRVPSEEALADFLDDAYEYDFVLYEFGKNAEADGVRENIERTVQSITSSIPHPQTAGLETALARVEYLEAIYQETVLQTSTGNQNNLQLSKQHSNKAVDLSSRAMSLQGAGVDTAYFQIRTLLNSSKDRQTEACELAKNLYVKQPLDIRVIRLERECFSAMAADTLRPGNDGKGTPTTLASANACYNVAVEAILRKDREKGSADVPVLKAKLIMVSLSPEDPTNPAALQKSMEELQKEGKRVGVLLPTDWSAPAGVSVYKWGDWKNPSTLSTHLYDAVKALDAQNVDVIVVPDGTGPNADAYSTLEEKLKYIEEASVDHQLGSGKGRSNSLAEACYNRAKDIVNKGLQDDPGNIDLLSAMVNLEIAMQDLSPGATDHLTNAQQYFVTALRGKSVYPNYFNEYTSIYNSISSIAFNDPQVSGKYYSEIAEALSKEAAAFPESTSIGEVVNDARMSAGMAYLHVPGSSGQAKEDFSQALAWFEKNGELKVGPTYSEKFSIYCAAYGSLSKLDGADGDIEGMTAQLEKMKDTCLPELEKYPWDFPLRVQYVRSMASAGQVLFSRQEYKKAMPYLQYASQWGDQQSSAQLARIHSEGLGTSADAPQANVFTQLAARQGTSYYGFSGIVKFDDVNISPPVLIQEWPEPFKIIDDQIAWWKNVRGGAVDPGFVRFETVLAAFAKEHKLPFAQLNYAFIDLEAENANPFNSSSIAQWFPQWGVPPETNEPEANHASEYDQAMIAARTFLDQKNYAGEIREIDILLKYEPNSAGLLGTEAHIYHEYLYDFGKAYDLDLRRVEVGAGGTSLVEAAFSAGHYQDCATLASAVRDAAALGQDLHSVDQKKLSPFSLGFRRVMGSLAFACYYGLGDQAKTVEAANVLAKDLTSEESLNWTYAGTEEYVRTTQPFAARKDTWVSFFNALEKGKKDAALGALKILTPQTVVPGSK